MNAQAVINLIRIHAQQIADNPIPAPRNAAAASERVGYLEAWLECVRLLNTIQAALEMEDTYELANPPA